MCELTVSFFRFVPSSFILHRLLRVSSLPFCSISEFVSPSVSIHAFHHLLIHKHTLVSSAVHFLAPGMFINPG